MASRSRKGSSRRRPPHPLLVEQWAKRIRALDARPLAEPVALTLSRIQLATARGGKFELQLVHTGQDARVRVVTNVIGEHRFPAPMRHVRMATKRRTRIDNELLSGFHPEFLARSAFPKKLTRTLRRAKFIDPKRRVGKGEVEITTVFAPDDRYTFSDTSFPWCTCGLVETGAGSGSGVMIGPRHLLTASHVVNWGPNNSAGWLRFTPLYFDGSAPFGSAYGETIYSWVKADSDHDGSMSETESAFDYVAITLDSRLGDITGWMGSRGYDDDWDGGDYWGHVGYPADVGGARRPVFIGYQHFDDEDEQSTGGRDSYEIKHKVDVFPGQSGGPFFGWWDGEPWPRVVSVQSGQNLGGAGGPNTCGGGNPLPELVNYARTQDP
jgi:V8-like Glu-specific endopeptidase